MGMPWLRCHNPEIDWKTGEVKMTRCPEECGKKWKAGKQTKPGWKKQEEKEKKRGRSVVEEEKMIKRILTEKKKEEDVMEVRTTEEIVPRRFYKCLRRKTQKGC